MQKKVLHTAVTLIGYPYVWGGTSEGPEAPFGVQAPGGFDCSGFVWNVYKLHAYAGAEPRRSPQGQDHHGDERRGPEEAEDLPREPGPRRRRVLRLPRGEIEARRDRPRGSYLGNGWLIHSSEYGVALAQLDGWYWTVRLGTPPFG